MAKNRLVFLGFLTIALVIFFYAYLNRSVVNKMDWNKRQAIYYDQISDLLKKEEIVFDDLKILNDTISNAEPHDNDFLLYSFHGEDGRYVYLTQIYKNKFVIENLHKYGGKLGTPDMAKDLFSWGSGGYSYHNTFWMITFGELFQEDIAYLRVYYSDSSMREMERSELRDGYIFIVGNELNLESSKKVGIVKLTALDKDRNILVDYYI